MRWAVHMARMGKKRGIYRVGKRSLGRPRCRREDNVKMYLEGIVWVCGMD
jgi:hypothetical protein